MPKQAAKKEKAKSCPSVQAVHDIINKVKDSQKKMDQKLAELSQMCSAKEIRTK